MIGVGGALEGAAVASDACRGRAGEGSADMALRASKSHVRSGEGEFGHGVVVEAGVQP